MNTFKIKNLEERGKHSQRGVLTYLVSSVSFITEEREKANSLKEKFPEEESSYTVHD